MEDLEGMKEEKFDSPSNIVSGVGNGGGRLSTFQSDVLLYIFDHLDPDSSACLGVTCKRMYDAYYRIYLANGGKVKLSIRVPSLTNSSRPVEISQTTYLYELLCTWMGRRNTSSIVSRGNSRVDRGGMGVLNSSEFVQRKVVRQKGANTPRWRIFIYWETSFEVKWHHCSN